MVTTYRVDMPETGPQGATYPFWLDNEVELKILEYDPANPLGVSFYVNWVVSVYVPTLVAIGGLLNGYAMFVLRSSFLRSLVIQPLIRTLLLLNVLMLLVGPLYVWLAQCFRIHLVRRQLYACFLLLWAHNFATIATASILVAMILERALSLGKPEMLWELWQEACRNTVSLIVVAALVLAVGGLMCVDGTLESSRMAYPICLPWWDNEHGSVSPLWNKIVTFNFSLGPALLIFLSMALLVVSLARFKTVLRSGVKALNYYNGLYLEIRSTLHTKFVKSVWWLGSAYVIASSPLGLFIIFGPAIYRTFGLPDGGDLPSTRGASSGHRRNDSVDSSKDSGSFIQSIISPLEYNYLLVSRSDTETLLWLLYYSFPLCTVPVLLATEVLFRREWNGLCDQIINRLLCRRYRASRVPSFLYLENEQDLAGPYIAQAQEPPASRDGATARPNAKNIHIYDASKAVRAGRQVVGTSYV